MGSDDDVIQLEEGAFRNRFFSEDIDGGAGDFLFGNGFGQQFFIDQTAAGAVDDPHRWFHQCDLFFSNDALCGGIQRCMNGDKIRILE